MILVKTLNDKIIFENKRDIILYFDSAIEEKENSYFDEDNEYIEINGERIESLEQWREWKSYVSEGVYNAFQELEDFLEEVITLFDMDNKVQKILDIEGKISIFDEDVEEILSNGEYTYIYWDDEFEGRTREINIEFEVIEESNYVEETIIKIIKVNLL
nr:hypothetical protein [Tissierella sp.]